MPKSIVRGGHKMLNQVVIVGKVKALPILKETSTGVKLAEMLIEVERNYKNSQGVFETDTLQCTLWRGLAESAIEECSVGALIGIKGRLQGNHFESKEGNPIYTSDLIAEKISYLHASD